MNSSPQQSSSLSACARLLLACFAAGAFAGCAQSQPKLAQASGEQGSASQPESDETDETPVARAPAPRPPAEPAPVLPNQDLTETILYEFLLAEIAGQRGNVGLAAQAYADIAKRTRDPRIARRATEVAIYARMQNTSIESARIWHETDPGSPRALQVFTGLLLNAGRLDEALPYLRKLLASEGKSAGDAFLQINRSFANAQDKAAVLRVVKILADDYPSLPEARFAVAQAALAAGDTETALAETRRAQIAKPDWEQAVLLEAQILQRTSGDRALERIAQFLAKYPNSREVRLSYARALVSEKQFPKARAEFQKLLADFPANTEVVYAVALLSLQLQDYGLAEANLKRLLELNYRDRDTVRIYLGQVAEEQKKFDEALRWYREVSSGEQFIPAQIRYAQVLSRQGKLDQARAHLQTLNPANAQQRVQIILAEASVLRDANRSREAFDLVEKALGNEPDQPDLLYDYAMLAEKLDRVDVLESSLRKLISIRPDHAHAYNALGYSLADRNVRLPEARKLIEAALRLSPDDSFIVDSMGWVLYRMGELSEAVMYLRRAYAGRADAEIAAHLGEVLWAMGERDEARKVLRDAEQKSPGNETLQNTLKRLKP